MYVLWKVGLLDMFVADLYVAFCDCQDIVLTGEGVRMSTKRQVSTKVVSCQTDGQVYKQLSNRSDVIIQQIPPIYDIDTKSSIIRDILKTHHKSLSANQIQQIVQTKLSDNPMFLTILANELQVFGSHEQLDSYLEDYLQIDNFEELWLKIVERWKKEYGCCKKHEKTGELIYIIKLFKTLYFRTQYIVLPGNMCIFKVFCRNPFVVLSASSQ